MALALVAGCQVDPKVWEERFGPEIEAVEIRSPAALLPLREGTWRYIIPGREDEQRMADMVIERVEDERFPYRRHTPEGRIEHLGWGEDGSILIGAVEDLQHNALTRYEPPLPLIPADLTPGRPVTTTARLTVVNRDHPEQIRDRGTCEQTIVYQADQSVRAPAGRFDCRRITTTYQAKLMLASVQQSSTAWYATGTGLIAEDYREQVRAFILNADKHRRIVLRAAPPPSREVAGPRD